MAFDPIGFALSKVILLVGENGAVHELRVDGHDKLYTMKRGACRTCRGGGIVCSYCGSTDGEDNDCTYCTAEGIPGTRGRCSDCAGTGMTLPPDMCRKCLGSGECCFMCGAPMADGVCTACGSLYVDTCYDCGGTGKI